MKPSLARQALLSGICLISAISAEAQLDKLKLADHIQQVKLAGDLRLRQDQSHKRGPGLNNRSRNHFRLRLGAEIQLPENLTANLRLASGTGEQLSANQSMGNLSSQKSIWIDTAYLKWAPKPSPMSSVSMTAGKMLNPLWRTYSSDLIWDDDLNPEGLAEQVNWLFLDGRIELFANALQMAADEDRDSGKNQWLFSQQTGLAAALPWKLKLRMAAAYHKWSDVNRSSLGAAVIQDGNRRTSDTTSGLLLNRFGVGEITTQISGNAWEIPTAAQATLARNLIARGDLTTPSLGCPAGQTCPTARDGYQYGLIVGSAKAAGTWEAAAFQKYSQSDVTVADAADSDFGDGGTNQQGQIFWIAYAAREWMQVKAKYCNVDTIDTQFVPYDKAVRRLQFDLSVKF